MSTCFAQPTARAAGLGLPSLAVCPAHGAMARVAAASVAVLLLATAVFSQKIDCNQALTTLADSLNARCCNAGRCDAPLIEPLPRLKA